MRSFTVMRFSPAWCTGPSSVTSKGDVRIRDFHRFGLGRFHRVRGPALLFYFFGHRSHSLLLGVFRRGLGQYGSDFGADTSVIRLVVLDHELHLSPDQAVEIELMARFAAGNIRDGPRQE